MTLVVAVDGKWINITSESQAELGPYDVLAVRNGTIFIVSGHPCSTGKTVSLTIARLKTNPLFIHYDSVKYGIEDPIQIGKF